MMSKQTSVEVLIVGGGLAGYGLAEALVRQGMEAEGICLLEASHPGAGSSGNVGAMLNPLPGRSLYPKPGYPEAFVYVRDWIAAQQAQTDTRFTLRYPVVRPLIEELGAEQMRRSFARGKEVLDFLEARELSAAEVATQYPLLAPTEGAIELRPGVAVEFGLLVRDLAERLREAGVVWSAEGPVTQLEWTGQEWLCRTEHEERRAKRVVLAVGADLDEWFPALPMQMTGGELAVFSPPEGMALNCMVSAAGYVTTRCDGNWAVGATFWHGQKHSDFLQEEIFERLRGKAKRLIPCIVDAKPVSTWFGVRAIFRTDRQPIVGVVPTMPSCYLMGAFASKGLLWIPWMAESLAKTMLQKEDHIHPAASILRLKEKNFVPAPSRVLL